MRRNGNGTIRRRIIRIDEDKCDGCGLCVPACAEGAIRVIDGKARLASDRFCDGLGACLGLCPRGALTIEEREGEPFDAHAVATHLSRPAIHPASGSGCPSAGLLDLSTPAGDAEQPAAAPHAASGALRHWPVQLHLLPAKAPFLRGADLLICAPCVPVAMPDFHARLLAGRVVALACPKLDDQTGYLEKLSAMFAEMAPRSVTVARMHVPCCGGLLQLVRRARDSSCFTVPIADVVVGHDGCITGMSSDAQPSAAAPSHEKSVKDSPV
jgi:NAD-dependent dihydropyrimidine dehydrogenase PreA subunit